MFRHPSVEASGSASRHILPMPPRSPIYPGSTDVKTFPQREVVLMPYLADQTRHDHRATGPTRVSDASRFRPPMVKTLHPAESQGVVGMEAANRRSAPRSPSTATHRPCQRGAH